MALKASPLVGTYMRLKPHLLMVLTQIGFTFVNFFAEASFQHGMIPYVYTTYRSIIASIFIFPFAYFLERKSRPKLTLAIFAYIFALSLFKSGLGLNLYFVSITYTSTAFAVSAQNTIPALTFVIAVLLRLETVNLLNARFISKVVGTLVSLAGVTTMTLYKGQAIRNLWHTLIHIQRNSTIHEQCLKGSIVTVVSCISSSIGYIMQATTLKRYPAQLSLTTWVNFLGAAQSAVFTVIVDHKPAGWRIGFNIDLWSAIYGGVVVSGLVYFMQLWCIQKRGPVFVTMFNPIATILVAILEYFVFGEKIYLGSIIGAVIVIVGLYLLLWGKEGDQGVHTKPEEHSFSACIDERRDQLNIQKTTSAENDIELQP